MKLVSAADLVVLYMSGHMLVGDGSRVFFLQCSQLVEVRREEAGAAQLGDDVVRDRPGQAEAVEGAGPAPQLVDDDQGVGRGGLQHHRRLQLQHTHTYRSCMPQL